MVAPVGGVSKEVVVEYDYYGDVLKNNRQLENGSTVNPEINVRNSISVLADEYANEHFHAIRYVRWAGTLWLVTDVEVRSPRLILTLGGVYNGPTPEPPDTP